MYKNIQLSEISELDLYPNRRVAFNFRQLDVFVHGENLFVMWARVLRLRFGRFDGINITVAITRHGESSN